jgi:hypothetical protein
MTRKAADRDIISVPPRGLPFQKIEHGATGDDPHLNPGVRHQRDTTAHFVPGVESKGHRAGGRFGIQDPEGMEASIKVAEAIWNVFLKKGFLVKVAHFEWQGSKSGGTTSVLLQKIYGQQRIAQNSIFSIGAMAHPLSRCSGEDSFESPWPLRPRKYAESMNPRLAAIQRAVELQEKCRATHFESRTVKVRTLGEEIPRAVETFNLHDHPGAVTRAYAWEKLGDGTNTDPQYTIVLRRQGVNSPEDALKSVAAAVFKTF